MFNLNDEVIHYANTKNVKNDMRVYKYSFGYK